MAKSAVASKLDVPETPTNRPKPKIDKLDFLTPYFGASDGYGSSAERTALALESAGLRVRLVGAVRAADDVAARHILDRFDYVAGDAIVFYTQPTRFLRQRGRKAYGWTMYETDGVPGSWFQGLRNVDEIWVPSEWQRESFAKAADRECHVVPLAVDAQRFPFKKRERGRTLRFFHHASNLSIPRKGAHLAMSAFVKAFPDRDDVSLTLRTRWPVDFDKIDARIQIMTTFSTHEQLLALYHGHDALIYPSRGEGFGLIPLEAMATGMPAIFPDSSGMHDYAEHGLTVSTRKVPVFGQYVITGESHGWWEPNLDELVDRMREVDQNYDAIMDGMEETSRQIGRDWTWEKTADAVIARLNA